MAEFTNRLEPEEVRFLMDFSELKDIVTELLGEANALVNVEIDYDEIEEPDGITIIRPMVKLQETSSLTEEDRHKILSSGLSIDREPFDNGDHAMERIFGNSYTVLEATSDADGNFFTIEMPFRSYMEETKS